MREENKTLIKCLNMFGRIPEQWELLKEIERLNMINQVHVERIQQLSERLSKRKKVIDKAIEYIKKTRYKECYETKGNFDYELLEILKGSDKE